jgi:hypothetical protein
LLPAEADELSESEGEVAQTPSSRELNVGVETGSVAIEGIKAGTATGKAPGGVEIDSAGDKGDEPYMLPVMFVELRLMDVIAGGCRALFEGN